MVQGAVVRGAGHERALGRTGACAGEQAEKLGSADVY